jgi:predicted nuclease of predicted toxin-antitoxin system
MRFLANENVPGEAVEALREDGHDVAWVRVDAPGSPDGEVLARASAEVRIVLTFDKDFGELAFHARLPVSTGIILVRLRAASPALLARSLVSALRSRSDWTGHLAVIEADRVRMRPLPTGGAGSR